MIKNLLLLPAKTALALFLGVSLAVAEAGKPASSSQKKPDAAPAKGAKKAEAAKAPGKASGQKQAEVKADDTAKGLGAIGSMLPLGQKSTGVTMPSFRDGKPSSLIEAESMTRVDDQHMDMEKVVIRLYGETQEADLCVQLITGAYDMTTQVLDSNQRSRVSRNDFQLEGDSMIFDTRTQQGKMVGNVHMVIYDANSLQKKPAAPPSPDAAKTAAPPPANKAGSVPPPAAEAKPAKVKK